MSRVDAPTRRFSALVIDDDQGLQGLFLTLLGRSGFSVDCALDGRQAYDYIRRGSYSVILLDLMMPGVNGFELLDRLGRDSPTLMSRIIIMTGAAQRAVESLDVDRVWSLVRKPFDIDQLLALTLACAQQKRS